MYQLMQFFLIVVGVVSSMLIVWLLVVIVFKSVRSPKESPPTDPEDGTA